jgi:hypothetical protein
LPSISWSTSQTCCSQVHIRIIFFWDSKCNMCLSVRRTQLSWLECVKLCLTYIHILHLLFSDYTTGMTHLKITLLGILFSSILSTCPNQRNLFNLTVSIIVGFLTLA